MRDETPNPPPPHATGRPGGGGPSGPSGSAGQAGPNAAGVPGGYRDAGEGADLAGPSGVILSEEELLDWVDGKVSAQAGEALAAASGRRGLASRVSQMQANRRVLQSLPIEAAPADLAERVVQALEREALLALSTASAASDAPIPISTYVSPRQRTARAPAWQPPAAIAAGLLLLIGGVSYGTYLAMRPTEPERLLAMGDGTDGPNGPGGPNAAGGGAMAAGSSRSGMPLVPGDPTVMDGGGVGAALDRAGAIDRAGGDPTSTTVASGHEQGTGDAGHAGSPGAPTGPLVARGVGEPGGEGGMPEIGLDTDVPPMVLAESAAPASAPGLGLAVAEPEEIDAERALVLAREGRLAVRVRSASTRGLALLEEPVGRVWTLSPGMDEGVRESLEAQRRRAYAGVLALAAGDDAGPAMASADVDRDRARLAMLMFGSIGPMAMQPPTALVVAPPPSLAYTADLPDGTPALMSLRASLATRLGARVDFVEVETPLAPLGSSASDAAARTLWWTQPTPFWTARVRVPVLIEPVD